MVDYVIVFVVEIVIMDVYLYEVELDVKFEFLDVGKIE